MNGRREEGKDENDREEEGKKEKAGRHTHTYNKEEKAPKLVPVFVFELSARPSLYINQAEPGILFSLSFALSVVCTVHAPTERERETQRHSQMVISVR